LPRALTPQGNLLYLRKDNARPLDMCQLTVVSYFLKIVFGGLFEVSIALVTGYDSFQLADIEFSLFYHRLSFTFSHPTAC